METDLAVDLIRNSGVSEYADELIARLRPSIRITTRRYQVEPSHDASKFGGQPLLPPGMDWPTWDATGSLLAYQNFFTKRIAEAQRSTEWCRNALAQIDEKLRSPVRSLAFLGQLKLEELPPVSRTIGLPENGRLLFFFDHEEGTRSFDPAIRGSARVIYIRDTDTVPSRLTPPPQEMLDEWRSRPCVLDFSLEQTLPIDARAYGLNLHVWKDNSPYRSLINELTDRDTGDRSPCMHRIGGYAENIQNPMELECQLVTNGVWCGDASGYNDPRRKALEAGAADWRLLLQLDSDDNPGWMWGDAGRLYFWIRQQDLAAEDFSHIWCIEQCY